MRIAVAGPGDVGRYLVEEFLAAGYEVVLISRTPKDWFPTQKEVTFTPISDYTVPLLLPILDECDAVVSTILEYTDISVNCHLAILEACKKSKKCKHFIPSEWAGNIEDYPNEPVFHAPNHIPVREALRAQKEVTYTMFAFGWIIDYIVPKEQRYMKDIGDFHPVQFEKGTMVIPGTGDEKITFTAARDGAKAVAALMKFKEWEDVTFVQAEVTTWNTIAKQLEAHGKKLKISYHSDEYLQKVIKEGNEDEVLGAQFEGWSTSGACLNNQEKVEAQKKKYFKDIKFRTVDEILTEAEKNPSIIL